MADQERLVKTLMELIKIDSPSGEEDAMDAEVSARLESMGLKVSHDTYNNVIAKLPGEGSPIMLSAHLDTVEPGRGIKPIVDGGVVRSDGSTILGGDCKAGVAIVLEGLAAANESNGGGNRAIEVVFTRHEEGGLVGAHHLDFSMVSATTGIVFDGEGPPNRIILSAPSQNVVTAQITGRAAHAGLEPEKGISALLIAADILGQLPLGRIDEETTANIGRLEGGLKRNIIPEQAFLDGEFRSRSNEKLADLERKFRGVFEEVASRYPEAKIDLDIVNTYQAYNIDAGSEAVAMISRALAGMGMKPVLETTGGGSDANVFIEKGITAVPVGIGVRDFHTTWETAVIAEVFQGAQMCEAVIRGA
ncbi:MAG TPA: M20/M25/M40 family metallo-hydrolase [Dehalococcoidia bacterium]|nr:M20/M25/M40 family metallo-hydrolase [Dehalococcoidia bacterium]